MISERQIAESLTELVAREGLSSAPGEMAGIRCFVTDSPTTFGFTVVAGAPGAAMPSPVTQQKPTWPTTTEPWYMVQAAGNADNDGTFCYLLSSSLNGEVYVENESE